MKINQRCGLTNEKCMAYRSWSLSCGRGGGLMVSACLVPRRLSAEKTMGTQRRKGTRFLVSFFFPWSLARRARHQSLALRARHAIRPRRRLERSGFNPWTYNPIIVFLQCLSPFRSRNGYWQICWGEVPVID